MHCRFRRCFLKPFVNERSTCHRMLSGVASALDGIPIVIMKLMRQLIEAGLPVPVLVNFVFPQFSPSTNLLLVASIQTLDGGDLLRVDFLHSKNLI